MKQCTQCARNGEGPKPLSEFNRSARSPDGVQNWCRACHKRRYANNIEAYSARSKKWRLEHPERTRIRRREWAARNPLAVTAKSLKHEYGLSVEQFEAIYERQNGRCAICITPVLTQIVKLRHESRTKIAHVDHCHKTNAVRGLLCFHCNIGLGKFRDSETNLLAAARYLRDTSSNRASAPAQETSRAQHVTLQGERGPFRRDPDQIQAALRRREELSPF